MSAEFLHRDAIAVNDVDSTDRLVGDFQAYSAWRGQLSQKKVSQLSRWLNEQDLEDAQTQMRIQSLLEKKLKDDKLNIAFVAEFRAANPS